MKALFLILAVILTTNQNTKNRVKRFYVVRGMIKEGTLSCIHNITNIKS